MPTPQLSPWERFWGIAYFLQQAPLTSLTQPNSMRLAPFSME
jgi:hypothetical protein